MSQNHVTSKGFCTYCGAKLKKCVECGEYFCAARKDHIYCSARCRTRKLRRMVNLSVKSEI